MTYLIVSDAVNDADPVHSVAVKYISWNIVIPLPNDWKKKKLSMTKEELSGKSNIYDKGEGVVLNGQNFNELIPNVSILSMAWIWLWFNGGMVWLW